MSDDEDFEVAAGTLLSSDSSDYEVLFVLGSGAYGEVAQCRKIATNKMVAVKIIKSISGIEDAKEEEETLKRMKEFGSDNFNIVRWNDSFTFEGRLCFEFEKLDLSLYDLQTDHFPTLELMAIRPIIQQLATALDFLKSIGIVHADLKPENVMVVDHQRQPLRLKVIDFGLACNNPQELTGAILQTLWYRAPEVLLGAPFNEAIDVWSLGCIAVEMLGNALFPGIDEYDMMRHIVHSIGNPPDHLLNGGMYTEKYFCKKDTGLGSSQWRFMSACEARNSTCNPNRITILSDLEKDYCTLTGEDADADECDWESFVDLLTEMMEVDSSERITPSKILQHPFITMSHLVGTFDNSNHVKMCEELMTICPDLSSDNGDDEERLTPDSFTEEFQPTQSAYRSPNWFRPTSPMVDTVPDEGYPARLSIEEQLCLFGCEEKIPAKSRKRDSVDDSECGNRTPDINPNKKRMNEGLGDAEPCKSRKKRKKRRGECQGAHRTSLTGGETSPQKSAQDSRRRDDAEPCSTLVSSSPGKTSRDESIVLELTSQQKSPLQVRKRDDTVPCSTSDGNSRAKTMWDECPGIDLPVTGGLTRPGKSPLQERKKDETDACSTLEDNSKRRNVTLSKELTDSVKQLIRNTEAWSGKSQVDHIKKRKRASVDISDSKEEKNNPANKRRQGSLDSGEV